MVGLSFILIAFVLTIVLRLLTRWLYGTGTWLGPFGGGRGTRRPGPWWTSTGRAEAPTRLVKCPRCGANNFTSDRACWQCRQTLPVLPSTAGPAGARQRAERVETSVSDFRVTETVVNGQRQIEVRDQGGRAYRFRSWDEAPAEVLEQVRRLPPPVRSRIERAMRTPPSIPPRDRPVPISVPSEEPAAPAPPEPQPAKEEEQPKPPPPRGTWLEF